MSDNSSVNRLTRIGSMLLDHTAMCMVIGLILGPVLAFQIVQDFDTQDPPVVDGFGPMQYLFYLGFAIYICKDGIEGRSPAKLLTKFQVVNAKTGEIAGPIRCCIRNLSIVIWPVEVVIAFFSPEKRLGDLIAGTRTIRNESINRKPQVMWRQLGFSLVIAYAFTLFIMGGMELLLFNNQQ